MVRLFFVPSRRFFKAAALAAAFLYLGFPARGEDAVQQAERAIERAWGAFEKLKSYQAVYEKEEWRQGKLILREKNFIRFEKPFVVFLNQEEGPSTGRQLFYTDRRENELEVRLPSIFFGISPMATLSPDDPRATSGGRYTIRDAGVGTVIRKFAERFENARKEGLLKVLSGGEALVGNERGARLDVSYQKEFLDYTRQEIVFSTAHGLPLETRLYNPDSELKTCYRYLGLRLDVSRDDKDFLSQADARMQAFFKEPGETRR